MSNKSAVDLVQSVRAYHTLSKHAPNRSAPGPGQLDWKTQPDPFRTFAGANRFALPLVADTIPTPHQGLYQPFGRLSPAPLDSRGVAALLELSLGLAAWKVFQNQQWPLRCNPSSGNLHPTEGYVVLPTLPPGNAPRLPAGLYHYLSRDHLLELRWQPAEVALAQWEQAFVAGGFLLGLSSIHWREAWKYGVRAFRYCQLDVGHAAAAVSYAAATLGWRATLLSAVADDDISRLLALNRGEAETVPEGQPGSPPEPEQPDLLLWISTTVSPAQPSVKSIRQLASQVNAGPSWFGMPNRLSPWHAHAWSDIDRVAAATHKPVTAVESLPTASRPPLQVAVPQLAAATLIRQRRSGQHYDPRGYLAKAAFLRLLDASLYRSGQSPWGLIPWPARIHWVLMVHRVTDLAPGLYLLLRRDDGVASMRGLLHGDFLWEPVADAAGLPLFRLAQGDMQATAQFLSCQQEIAADGAFSVGMLGEFEAALAMGAWGYRHLYWEAGILGHILYLEAEAEGMRGTGIGCYFDDFFHQMLGLRDGQLQSLYHFTVGKPIEDDRLQTRPPYSFVDNR
ncbi:MAG: SagB/ThcOx family dehydrogenase [Magnetococcales bacterium]|nr:SagB/ThcOx family dehydrogenase [Magnetococcales bacterium]